jgi:catalase-peroxidase
LEGAWTVDPVTWDNNYFDNLFGYDWEQTKSPAGATQWIPRDSEAANLVPDAHEPDKRHAPIMFTTDLALKLDPIYGPISKRFHQNPEEFSDAFSRAWFKLTHRDLGPYVRGLGPLVPAQPQLWQDPVPDSDHELVGSSEIAKLKSVILKADLTVSQLVKTAWASASSFRGTDKRGGANGARVRLEPQKSWTVNEPVELNAVLSKLEKVTEDFNRQQSGGVRISLADIIVLGGCVGVEAAARSAGYEVVVPFTPGRMDAVQEETDVASFSVLEPAACGFINYIGADIPKNLPEALVDRAHFLTLNITEMTVLLGGMRVLNTNYKNSKLGKFTERPETLTNDFFVNLLDMNTEWTRSESENYIFEGRNGGQGTIKWMASEFDLIFGSNSQLRAISEVFATNNSEKKFVDSFVKVWSKVMELDRFELER